MVKGINNFLLPDRILLSKLNWLNVIHFKTHSELKIYLCWYNVNSILINMESKAPHNQVAGSK